MLIEPEPKEEPPNKWWNKNKENILIWTSLGSFIISLLQFLVMVVKYWRG